MFPIYYLGGPCHGDFARLLIHLGKGHLRGLPRSIEVPIPQIQFDPVRDVEERPAEVYRLVRFYHPEVFANDGQRPHYVHQAMNLGHAWESLRLLYRWEKRWQADYKAREMVARAHRMVDDELLLAVDKLAEHCPEAAARVRSLCECVKMALPKQFEMPPQQREFVTATP